MFCTSGPNLVIVAWAGDKLSSGQTDDWRTHTHTYTHTHTHTHRQTQATTIPEGHNWPRVKTDSKSYERIPRLFIYSNEINLSTCKFNYFIIIALRKVASVMVSMPDENCEFNYHIFIAVRKIASVMMSISDVNYISAIPWNFSQFCKNVENSTKEWPGMFHKTTF